MVDWLPTLFIYLVSAYSTSGQFVKLSGTSDDPRSYIIFRL